MLFIDFDPLKEIVSLTIWTAYAYAATAAASSVVDRLNECRRLSSSEKAVRVKKFK